MADYNTYRTAQGVGHRTAAVDQGLRAYINKVYGCLLYTSDAADE